jgi:hypothetical protein
LDIPIIKVETILAKSGERCPQSGIWEVVGFLTTTVSLAKGKEMPDYCGKAVVWRLLQIG